MIPTIKAISSQATDVYKLLSDGQVLSAQEIADKLSILPNAVYRVAKKLIDMGVVEQVDSYPVRFKAIPAQTALSLYLVAAAYNFRRDFGLVQSTSTKSSNSPKISLIKDRPSMLRRAEVDARAAKQSIDWIVSGHEVPESTFLAYQKAALSGAKLRKIVHQKEQKNSPIIRQWQAIGVEVRYLSDFQMRMLIFDKRIVHITSFDPKNYRSAFGVRFEYEPLAMQMTELFEQNWQKAEVL